VTDPPDRPVARAEREHVSSPYPRSVMQPTTRSVVVTGGGTGIGFEIARTFAMGGAAVTITGRRADLLADAAARIGARAVPFDASDPSRPRCPTCPSKWTCW
jgi:NADP-dependent 3-hydroxy acid dehydrogenase YdfG